MNQFIKKYVFSKAFIIPRIILLLLLLIHENIKPRTIRTLQDMFYWPDGICLDMIIVYVFLIGSLHILLMDLWDFQRTFMTASK